MGANICYSKEEQDIRRRKGFCWEGPHCNNPLCPFKHMGEDGEEVINSIRGPRQHRTYDDDENLDMEDSNVGTQSNDEF